MKPFRILLAAVATVAAFALAACGFTKGKEVASKAVDLFHEQYNAGKLSEIYRGATTTFQSSSSEAKFLEFMRGVQSRFGAMRSTTSTGWRTNATTSGTFVVLGYKTQFEKGSAQETFTFVISGENAALQGYNINSPDLFTASGPAATPATAAPFASAAEAQQEAVRRYPELGQAGSVLNREFVARHKQLQSQNPEALRDPSWPLRVAEEAAKAVGKK